MSITGKKAFRYGVPALLALVLIVGLATNCRGKFFDGFMTPERVHKMITWKVNDVLDELDATDFQRTRVHEIKDRLFNDGHKFHAAGIDDHKLLLDQWRSETLDRDVIDDVVDRQFERKREMSKKVIEAATEIHEILTPAQREKIAVHIEEHMAMFEEHLKAE